MKINMPTKPTNIDTKEIEVYKAQVAEAYKFSESLDIKNEGDYQSAMSMGLQIKGQLDLITSRKEQITKPLNSALKSTRELFKPLEEVAENALMVIKKRMLRFTTEKERKIEEGKAKIDARVEKGTLKEGTGEVKKFILDNSMSKTVTGMEGSATTKKVKKYYVTNIAEIPLDFLVVDMVKVRASYKSGFPVPGIEERLESDLAFNTN